MQLKLQDYVMGIGVAVTWGMGLVFAKAAIDHFPPILLMGFRFLLTTLVLVWFVKPPWASIPKIFGIAFIASAVQYSLTFTGLKGLDASTTALVVQLEVPFLVLLGVVLLKERPGLRKWLGIALAFGGVGLIAGEPRFAGAWGSIGLVISGAFMWAIGQVLVRKLKDIDGLTTTAWMAVCATPQIFIMSAIFETGHIEAIRSAGLVVWGAVVYLGLIMTALGYGMWYTLVRKHQINKVAPFLLLLPVSAVIGGVIFLGEALTLTTVIGGAIVIAGVTFITVERVPAEDDEEEADEFDEDEYEYVYEDDDEDEDAPEDDDQYEPDVAEVPAAARSVTSEKYAVTSWPDGSRYEGEWLNGEIHGYGKMTWGYASAWPGDVYEGEWRHGRLDGEGVYTFSNGKQIAGLWRHGHELR